MTKQDLQYEFGLFIDLKTGHDYDEGSPAHLILFKKGEVVYKYH